MAFLQSVYDSVKKELAAANTILIAVSKTKPVEDILESYNLGQRDFGENYVQELVDKYEVLPKDIRWHFIGHLQSNKVKYIAPFVHLIHTVDSERLLKEIDKQAGKNNRIIDCLLQVHIAKEETKFGLDEQELNELILRISKDPKHNLKNVKITGLMGMASFSNDTNLIREEFKILKNLFDKTSLYFPPINEQQTMGNVDPSTVNGPRSTLSMGMSSDYKIAIEEGSNMVRIGSLLFGERN